MTKAFDVVVLGAGPGGQVAAIRAAQLGLRTACVDNWTNLRGGPAPGGTCTNIGCIPAKALLQSSDYFERAARDFPGHGITAQALRIDVTRMLARKDRVVQQNNDGILYLFRKNKVEFFHGTATFVRVSDAGSEIAVTGPTTDFLIGRHVIVATGSSARALPQAPFDEVRILSNDGALRMSDVPRSLAVIGAGVVGLELGSVWRRLGSTVTMLEGLARFLPAADAEVAREAKKSLDKQGLQFKFGVRVGAITRGDDGVTIAFTDAAGEAQVLEAERVIVSIGRVSNTAGLGAEAVGLARDARGAIEADAACRTNLPGGWAIGDVVRGPMLAHKAEEEGVAVAERIAGQLPEVDFNTVPWVVYTHPEIAWVGQNEEQLTAAGRSYKVGTFPFMANGRARAMGDTTGFAKVIVDASSDDILGVHLVGPSASELIAEGVIAMEFRASSDDIARICHAHPTLSEALREAALAAQGRALNS